MSVGLMIRYPERDVLHHRYYIVPKSKIKPSQREILEKLDNRSIEVKTKYRLFGRDKPLIRAYATPGCRRDCPIDLDPDQEKFLHELLVGKQWINYLQQIIAPDEDELPLRCEQYTLYCY
jgi:hypothetical protein